MTLKHYRGAFSESTLIENSYDPNGRMGLMIASQAPAASGDPLEHLIAVEEWLQRVHGMTFLQAVRAGVMSKLVDEIHH